ncbi:polyprenyl synthetase family protein [Alphaproteobacteria bacterium]|nr:polyprenyl synthetase family protein [Alphaproteobacteria bacterium]
MKIVKLKDFKINDSFEEFYNWLQKDLNQVNKIILESLETDSSLITELSNHIIGSGGKRIRPLLTLATARLCHYSGNRHLTLASVIEFIHTATLLHDDVVDGSKKRRGKKTANFIWGNKSSILVGDFLLSKAFKILINDGSLKCIDIVSNVSEKISFGEVKQLMSIGKLNVSESDYLEIIGFKTAELFSAACQLSSEISEIDFTKKKSLKDFGYFLGIAYQIIDDTLDYFSEEKISGKEIGNDFKENKMTLPLILFFKRGNKKEKNLIQHMVQNRKLNDSDFNWVSEKMKNYDILDDCLQKARHFSVMAKDSLGTFPDNEEKRKLINLVNFLTHRKN